MKITQSQLCRGAVRIKSIRTMRISFKQRMFKVLKTLQWPVCSSWSVVQPPSLCGKGSCRDLPACVMQLWLPELPPGEVPWGQLVTFIWASEFSRPFFTHSQVDMRWPLQGRALFDFTLKVSFKAQFLPLSLQQLWSKLWGWGEESSFTFLSTTRKYDPNLSFAGHSSRDVFPNVSQPQLPHLWLGTMSKPLRPVTGLNGRMQWAQSSGPGTLKKWLQQWYSSGSFWQLILSYSTCMAAL